MLKVVLRLTAVVMVPALVAVVMPRSWMAAAHRGLGLGELPGGVLVEYLARTSSALYGAIGVMLWLLSCDVLKYASVIRYIGAAFVVLALTVVTVLSPHSGEPGFAYVVIDASTGIAFGVVVLILAAKIRRPR